MLAAGLPGVPTCGSSSQSSSQGPSWSRSLLTPSPGCPRASSLLFKQGQGARLHSQVTGLAGAAAALSPLLSSPSLPCVLLSVGAQGTPATS